jgi:glycosyltransferase involved in cell wall biosynthesis
MQILFIHQNFPGQFVHLSSELAKRGHDVRALAIDGQKVSGVVLEKYGLEHLPTKGIHLLAAEFEIKVIRAQACAKKMMELRDSGFDPELIVAHPGWGESIFCKSVFPKAKLINFLEFHYGKGDDAKFDPEFATNKTEDGWRIWVKNAHNFLNYEDMDGAYTPTHWQKKDLPDYIKNKVKVVFDGIDTQVLKPDEGAYLSIKSKAEEIRFAAGEEILTFANRNLEPYRGYHSFMRSLPKIMKARPNVKVLIVGGNDVSYGAKPPAGKTWKDIYLDEVKDQIDLKRVFFLGTINRSVFTNLLQISRCHVYFTYPFVMSWSAVEALSVGALVVGSSTTPVKEFIKHGENGLLVDFFNYEEISSTVIDCLANPKKYDKLRKAARESIVKNYDLKTVCLPKQIKILRDFIKKPL